MPGYIIVDVKTRKTIAISAAIAVSVFVIGILIGYFSGKSSGDSGKASTSSYTSAQGTHFCGAEDLSSPDVTQYVKRYLERHSTKHSCLEKASDCLDFDLPRNYIAYHLQGKTINIDGKLDDPAWQEVPWSELFVDIRSAVYPMPYLDTKVKVRWDDERVYVGAYIQDRNLWGTITEQDARLHLENNFEVFFDVDGSLYNYKQIQVNVLGTIMDQMLYMSNHDTEDRSTNMVKTWHGDVRKAIYTEGTVNQPNDTDKFWSAEMSFTFKTLAANSNRQQERPADNEVWFMQFGRAQYQLNVANGQYYTSRPMVVDWWSWQACDAINLQLQDRWGLVQFKHDRADKKFSFPKWHVYKALFETFTAMKKHTAVNSKRTNQITELDLPPYLLSGTCVEVPEIKFMNGNSKDEFVVTVKSKLISHKPAHITNKRYVTFN